MQLEAEHWVTIIVSLTLGIPGIVAAIKQIGITRATIQEKLRELTLDFYELLSVCSTYDLILQKVFMEHPQVNGALKSKWIEASGKLANLRLKKKSSEGD